MAEVGGNRPTSGPWWRPDRFAPRHDKLMARSRILAAVRDFFAENGFVEVETPALQVSPGLEPHLRAFGVVPHVPFEGKAQPRFLHTSPEFAMKKLLAAGLPRIWQLAHVFRDGERSATHHPEFSMLEWYRAAAGYEMLMADCEALLRRTQRAAGTAVLTWQGATADANQPFERLSVADAFKRHCGIDLANAFGELTDAQEQRRRFLADQAKKQTLYGETYPIDEDFLAALEHGLPDCAGIALGFDRLVMLLTGAAHIEEVLWAPVAPPD